MFTLRNFFYALNIILALCIFVTITEIEAQVNNEFQDQIIIITSRHLGEFDVNYNPIYYEATDSCESGSNYPEPTTEFDSTKLHNSKLGNESTESFRDVRINSAATSIDY